MSRYRRITPISLEEQERIISQNKTSINERGDTRKLKRQPPPRPPIAIFMERLGLYRSGETRSFREIVNSTCFNLRGVCQNIRTFADDMENLLSSVETIAPVVEGVVSGYTRSLKSKEQIIEKKEAPVNMSREETESPPVATNTTPEISAEQSTVQITPSFSGKMPTEEEVKEFLNNPLVSTLMQVVAKNLVNKR